MIKLSDNKKTTFFKLLFKKYTVETFAFMICIIIVLWLELTNYRFYIDTTINFNKINSLISNFSLAYIASYIFWITNYFFKYVKDIRIIYPQLKSITDNLFAVYDDYISDLKDFYKDIFNEKNESFILNTSSLTEIIEDAKKNDTKIERLCGVNYKTAAQINYDIDLLLKYNIYLDTSFFAIIMDIGRNVFIIQHKMNLRNDLSIFEALKNSVVKLSEQVNTLHEYTKNELNTISK